MRLLQYSKASCRTALLLALWAVMPVFQSLAHASEDASVCKVAGSVQVLFSPWDDPERAIVAAIDEAKTSVRVQAYIFTSSPVARALTQAHARGVRVEVLADSEQTARVGYAIARLAKAGVTVHLEVRYAAAHNKIILIDAETPKAAVITGSYNYTYSARAKNAENLLVIRGNPCVTAAYLDNYRRHRQDAVPYADLLKLGQSNKSFTKKPYTESDKP